ncbi:GNAT family N-acetyltransferase [Marinomonas sp. C2222]|uniref:GNAT family N-acetyltransferase n=1 Tax=Marinomonas sargassi TaxID=2984494 RepID=A0ABT2YRF9_9GAMM|nr:GNAT family N-acetyltransferase [Marinomonas sargassi]MCV2402467.1 GNAT family N-acetyltransferase [Marinomonas sargassi]
MKVEIAKGDDGLALAELRVLAMRESLESIGRFDPKRARERFLSSFQSSNTHKVIDGEKLVAFYVIENHKDHLFLDHLYVHPSYQGKRVGSEILLSIIDMGVSEKKAIRLGALKGSRSNNFYMAHGFVKTHEEEFDNYYELAFE